MGEMVEWWNGPIPPRSLARATGSLLVRAKASGCGPQEAKVEQYIAQDAEVQRVARASAQGRFTRLEVFTCDRAFAADV
jgi:hypothetical protein